MNIAQINKNGDLDNNSNEHVEFYVDGVRNIEWLDNNRCTRNDESNLGLFTDYSDSEKTEIWDYVDAQLESLD